MDIAHLLNGGVWRVAAVSQQPSLTLVRWQVLQLPSGRRHFAGWAVQNREGRASTAIVEFDAASMCGVTASGRVYQLDGPPGEDSEGTYVWQAWSRINDELVWADVSKEVWACKSASDSTST